MSSKMSKKNSEEISLDAINKQIAEMKKKISLLGRPNLKSTHLLYLKLDTYSFLSVIYFVEGQRKAHYEMWDTEKKHNGERIKILKENIKKLYTELGKCASVKNFSYFHVDACWNSSVTIFRF